MDKKQRILIIICLVIIVGSIGASLGYYYLESLRNPIGERDLEREFDGDFNRTFPPPEFKEEIEKGRENFELYIIIKSAITLINIIIALILIAKYTRIYQEVKSDFTMGLIVVMFALLIYAVTSNPFIQSLFEYRAFGLGPFLLIPDIFTAIALSVLLYLSLK
jgi:hypothetical protein